MAVFYQPIFTQTVGSGGTGTLNFNNIPQTFTDLKIVISSRCDLASANAVQGAIRFNNDTASNYSDTELFGTGSTANATRSSTNYSNAQVSTASTATASTFANSEIYIPNYTGSNYKSFLTDSVPETNGTTFTFAGTLINAGLWRSASAITSISLFPGSGANFAQYSTFSLYGVLRSGV